MFAKMKYIREYNEIIKRLNDMAVVEGSFKYWKEPVKEEKPKYWWSYQARSTDIEQTSYALLAQLEMDGSKAINKVVPTVRWLSKQRNSLGGWSSTQDTVLAMQALAKFAELAFGKEGVDLQISVSAQNLKENFNVQKSNALVLQRAEGFTIPTTVKIGASGRGCALIQVTMKYHQKKAVQASNFEVKHTVTPVPTTLSPTRNCRSQKIEVCSRWKGGDSSNMALLTIQMVSGFEVDPESVEEALKSVRGLKDVEMKGKDAVLYFNMLNEDFKCVTLLVHQTSRVQNTKPALIKVYDYYDTDLSASLSYNFSVRQCGRKQ